MKKTALFVFGGLPGVGKTTVAKTLAQEIEAVYLRVDTIEQTLRTLGMPPAEIGPAGYVVAYRLAEENLCLGKAVVADCVNPLRVTRDAWLATAGKASAVAMEIEVICSDQSEHRRRVETRISDLYQPFLPSWKDVIERNYEAWIRPHFVLDTADSSIVEATARLIQHLKKSGILT